MSELKCPACRCRTFAKVDEPTLDGGWDNSKLIRCVECKRTYAAPPRRPDAPRAGEGDSFQRMQELEAAVSDAMDIVGWYGPDGAGLRLAMLEWSYRFEDLLPAPPQTEGEG